MASLNVSSYDDLMGEQPQHRTIESMDYKPSLNLNISNTEDTDRDIFNEIQRIKSPVKVKCTEFKPAKGNKIIMAKSPRKMNQTSPVKSPRKAGHDSIPSRIMNS